MSKKKTAIYYSGATDVTGKALADALGITGAKAKPTKAFELVFGWGAKTKEATNFPAGTTVLNHPDNIRNNRNKLKTLELLQEAKVNVAAFVSAEKVLAELKKKKPALKLPLVGRTKFHQGGKGFWMCNTEGQIKDAIGKGAQYFQNYIGIKNEYRLHVFKDTVIYAQKKAQRDNMEAAFSAQYGDKIKAAAEKSGQKLDEATLNYALGQVSKRVMPEPDMHIRSNTRGWKFISVKPLGLGQEFRNLAIKAVKAVGLDFGAVDCCVDEEGDSYVIEINSGPGLEKTAFDKYVEAFEGVIKDNFEPKKAVGVQKKVAAVATQAAPTPGSAKARLASKAALMAEMIGAADENEAAALESVFGKMFR